MKNLPVISHFGSVPDLLTCPGVVAQQDWNGKALDEPLEFLLGVVDGRLCFGATFDDCVLALGEAQSFTEGLWNQSAVELFVYSTSGTGPYLEFNLSPTGAWWAAGFSEYRVKADQLLIELSAVRVYKQKNNGRINVALLLPIIVGSQIVLTQSAIVANVEKYNVSLEHTRGRISAENNTVSRSYVVRKYCNGFSAKKLLQINPDFHHPELSEVFQSDWGNIL